MVVRKQASVKSIKRRSRKAQKAITGRAKEFLYRGHTLEELQGMELDELLPLLPARARRSYSREMNHEQKKLFEDLLSDKQDIKTHVRDIIILPQFVGKTIELYNGHSYLKFDIKGEMIGHYLGEFAPTRKEVKHSGPGVGATRSSKFLPLK
ncbi:MULTISPECIES: 30S ribosomal protein S19 [Acidiplasma]|jgi:small subunit ribosomal protein S19|uniref:Small ribosomal subunit protein uS19 n=2 Tax=Acidiplasma TaxID=507753 RepID=A0A0Q0WIU7_9ARCH|nr:MULTISPECIES: 30S ribosomal protein S19 [Acidiplasma]KJE49466.1 30S ribosomal protein S19 [Acidiplasma sp. MBA-1]KPV46398.1 30S ribosomal protein S19 [Acidiplasma aeolicum]KQB35531.1 30S ribosomal protein S19 [Acidiplasma cupricumulans]KQB36720.1 30S ribosomal protein S19 [Acidiplasma aeolicum]WMT54553.1 MAG: 30S ribosomal protein S19 [Acidiplasma sp.]